MRELPARRSEIELHTADGLTLVGEVALPESAEPVATVIALHPLPTAGGCMDSHIIRKVAARLPALADVAVVRFNTRGTRSPRGASAGEFDGGITERHDVAAAVSFARDRGLPAPWLVGWSFGTELALKYGPEHDIVGAILLSPPLHRTSREELAAWHGDSRRLIALIPERDDFLPPVEAAERFSVVPEMTLIAIDGGTHLWVGESQTRRILTEVVAAINPAALPLPNHWPADAAEN